VGIDKQVKEIGHLEEEIHWREKELVGCRRKISSIEEEIGRSDGGGNWSAVG